VVAFEPVPTARECLVLNIPANVQVEPFAIADTEGVLKMYPYVPNCGGSFISNHPEVMAPRIEALKPLINTGGRTVLCLAARNESEAWTDADFLAIGIDLNPGENNRFVVVGDFHALQFRDGVFDVVFTNSLSSLVADRRSSLASPVHAHV
jgi:hypothetical protein